MADELTAEALFGGGAPSHDGSGDSGLTADQLFGETSPPKTGPWQDAFWSAHPILNAFGQGAKQNWGSEPFGLSPESEAELVKAGLFNDYKNGQHSRIKGFNEALIRPAAAALDVANRTIGAVIGGAEQATAQTGIEAGKIPVIGKALGLEQLGRAGAEAIEYATQRGDIVSPVPELPHAMEIPRARSLGVIGEGEKGYFGLAEPTPENAAARTAAIKDMNEALKEQPGATGALPPGAETPAGAPARPAAAPDVPDVHAVARQIAPGAFNEYDGLTARRDTYRRWIGDLGEARATTPRAAELQSKIDDILGKVSGVEDRLTAAAARRLDEARDELHDILHTDTADMAHVRRALQETDFRLRDLTPQVAGAYREAATRLPEAVEHVEPLAVETSAAPVTEQRTEAVDESAPIADVAPRVEAPPQPEPVSVLGRDATGRLAFGPHTPINIAADVSQKLVAAGRPAEEASAAAALVDAHYTARAARFGGKMGTAQELYDRDAPDIRGAGRKEKVAEFAQGQTLHQPKRGSLTIREGRNTIKLFKDADASTFIHETGHQWLEELLRDAGHELAPEELRADARTVRAWLGASDGEAIARAQHEKFARGFERYVMEGVAPSRALAQVFARFKAWLTDIYQTVARLRAPINDDIRAVFDRLLAERPERTIVAPERAGPRTMADLHEEDAEHTPPEHAAIVADTVRAEIDNVVREKAPELADEFEAATKDAGIAGQDESLAGGGDEARPNAGETRVADATGTQPAGRNEIAAEGAPSRKSVGNAYAKVPKEPRRLTDFVQQAGGLRDDGGDVAAIIGGTKGRPGLIRKNGVPIDDAALHAWENGYFPGHAERPTPREFLKKLENDIRGTPQYSEFDADNVAAFNEALQRNSEVDRLASELGIDAKDMTRAEFFAAASEKLSVDRMAEEIRSQTEAFETEFAAAEREAKEWVEAQGDAWEPELVYREGASRTLEDLENERKQEDAAGGMGEVARRAPEPEPPAADQGEVQEGDGSRGYGARIEPTAGATEQPSGPNASFPRGDDGIIDKAGNIRLDLLNTPESVNEIIRDAARENNDFLADRRGVVSDAQVLDLADAMGEDPTPLLKIKLGQAYNAEEIVWARKMLVQSATETRDAMIKAATGTDADVLAYAALRDRHKMIQKGVAQITAEAGRALRAFRGLKGKDDIELMQRILSEETGLTLDQLRREASKGAQLETPQQVSKLLHDSDKPTFWDKIQEFWINALLSGPRTHVKNIIGNSVVAYQQVAETYGAAIVGRLLNSKERIEFNEAKARLFGINQGAKEGLAVARAIWADEDAIGNSRIFEQSKKHPKAIGGKAGKIVRAPTRLLTMEDKVFYAIGYRSEINFQAYHSANQLGLVEGTNAFNDHVAQFVMNPSEGAMEAASKNAAYQTFTNSLGPTGRAIQNFANSHFLAKFLVPFLRTPLNLQKYARERTVLGLISPEIRGRVAGAEGEVTRDTQIARMAIGTSIAVAGAALAWEALVTSSGPSEGKKKSQLYDLGWQPYSVKVGEGYLSYQWLDPVATIIGVSADMADIIHSGEQHGDAATKVGLALMESVVKTTLDKTSLRSISDFIKMASDPPRYGDRYVQGFAQGFVPSIVRQTAQMFDPEIKAPSSALEALEAGIPFLSRRVPGMLDVWGQPVTRDGVAPGFDAVNPAFYSPIKDDATKRALLDIGYYPSMPSRKIRGVELSDAQYQDYVKISGRMMKMQLDHMVALPGFSNLSQAAKYNMASNEVNTARKIARDLVMMQSRNGPNDIMKKASDNKVAPLQPH